MLLYQADERRELLLEPDVARRDVALCRGLVDPPLAALSELEMLHHGREVDAVTLDARLGQGLVQQPAGRPPEPHPSASWSS